MQMITLNCYDQNILNSIIETTYIEEFKEGCLLDNYILEASDETIKAINDNLDGNKKIKRHDKIIVVERYETMYSSSYLLVLYNEPEEENSYIS